MYVSLYVGINKEQCMWTGTLRFPTGLLDNMGDIMTMLYFFLKGLCKSLNTNKQTNKQSN